MENVTHKRTGRHDSEEQECGQRDEKVNDTDCQRDAVIMQRIDKFEDIDRWSSVDDKQENKEHESTQKRLRTGEFSRDVCPFRDGGDDLDETADGASQGNGSPLTGTSWIGFFGLLVVRNQKTRRVECCVVPEHSDMNDPDTIEVRCHVEP